jgi:hypothetical protein
MSVAGLQSTPMAPAPSPARPISPAPPPLTEPPLDQAQTPSASVTQAMAGPTPQHNTVKSRARRRPPLAARRSHALFAHSWAPASVEPCRYRCDWAEATEATAWHGGGY